MSKNKANSSAILAKIFRKKADGASEESVAEMFGFETSTIRSLFEKASQFRIKSKKSKRHKLTQSERIKGGQASQLTKSEQHQNTINALVEIVSNAAKATEFATVTYYLRKGSCKEFSVVLHNEDIAKVFIKALNEIGVPESSVVLFYGKSPESKTDEDEIRKKWGSLGNLIIFSDKGRKASLFLKVKAFILVVDGENKIKVSSRSIARTFDRLGEEAIKDAAK